MPSLTTAGSLAQVCRSSVAQNTTLSYTASANSPTSYSIDWNAAANAAGLTDQATTVFSFNAAGGTINNIIVPGNTQAGTYTGTLTLTNANGCTQTQAVSLNVSVNAAPAVTSASSTTAPICSGESATITLAGLLPNVPQTIYYTIVGTTGTQSATVTANGSGGATFSTVPLSQTNSGQTLAIVSITRNDVTPSCSYNPATPTVTATLPTVSGVLTAPGLSYSPNVARICAGQVITISTTPGTGGNSGSAYDEYRYKTPTADWSDWSPTAPTSFTTVAGTYSVEARRSDPQSGCKVSGSTLLSWTIYGQPTVSAPSITDQTVCQDGTAKQLSVTASGGIGNFTYEWYANTTDNNTGGTLVSGPAAGPVLTPNISTFTPPATALGTLYYYVKVYQSGSNCGPVTSTTAAVTVIPKPSPGTLTKTPAVAEVCPGTSVSADLTPGTGGGTTATDVTEYSYDATGVWTQYTPGDAIPTAGHTRVQVRTYRKSPETGCSQSGYATVDWTISALPNAIITVNETSGTANNDGALCAEGSATLTISGGVSYVWSTGETTPSIAVTPTATTIYQVTVTDTKGCTSVVTRTITVSSIPSPKITSTENSGTTPNDGAICTGTPVTLNVSGGTAYHWITTNQTGSSITVSPNATTEYEVTVDNAGCSSTDKYTVYVNPLPTPAIAVAENSGTANDGTVCASTSVTLTARGGTSYLWANNNATTDAITVSPMTNTTYSVKATDDNGCFASVSRLITVNPLPTASISGTTAVCQGSTQPVVTFTGANGTAPYTFTYKINNGPDLTVTTTAGNSVTVSQPTTTATTYTYTLVSVKDASSTQCTQAQSGTATITINPLPTATISGDATVCLGSTAPNITFTGSGGTAPYTFTYKIGNGANVTVSTASSNNSVTVPQSTGTAGTYTYTLVSVKDASSTTCSQAQTGTATVTVVAAATVTKPGSLAFCHNTTATVPAFTGTNATSFTWTNDKTAIGLAGSGTGNLPSFTATNAGSTPITANITVTPVNTVNGVSCNGTPQTFTITINPLPTATISGNATVCQNSTQPVVTFTGANGTAPYTFTYTLSNGTTTTTQTATTALGNSSVTVPQSTATAGTYTYTLVSVKDGTSTTCSQNQSGTVTINVNPLPTGTISGATAVCQNSPAPNITFTGAGGTAPYTFTYQINGGAVQTATTVTGNSVTVSQPTGIAGTYTYTLVSVKDASSTTCSQTQTGTAVITVNPLPTVSIGSKATLVCATYPNYSSSYTAATLSYTGNTGSQYNITWDAAGKAAGLQDIAYTNLPAGNGNISIPIPANPAGGTFTGTLTVKSSFGCISAAQTFTLTLATHTIAAPGGITTFCFIDSKTPVTFDMTGSIPGYTYFLWDINVGTNDPQGQHTLKPPDNGGAPWQFTMYGQNKNWCYQVASISPEGCITVSNLICPTLPPTANIATNFYSCGTNSTATLTATLTDATAAKWQVSTDGGKTWQYIDVNNTTDPYTISTTGSVTSTTLTVTGVTSAMTGWMYRLDMAGANGSPCTSVQSPTATLNYAVPVTVTSTAPQPAAYCQGTAAGSVTTLTVTANGTGLTYQWYQMLGTTPNPATDTKVGTNSSSFTPPTTTVGTFKYYVVVTNACNSQTSPVATITINEPTVITLEPTTGSVSGSAAYCQGSGAGSFTVAAKGTGTLRYQWYSNTTNSLTGAKKIPNETSPSFTPPTNVVGTTYYFVEVTGDCGTVYSQFVAVVISKLPVLSSLADLPTPCYNSPVTLNIFVANPSDVSGYQWYKDGKAITGATSQSYTINAMTPAEAGKYYVVVQGNPPCGKVQSNEINLTSYSTDVTIWNSGLGTNEWHQDLNWTCKMPNLYRDALVPIVPNKPYPYIAAGLVGRTRNLTIDAGGPSVTLDGTLQMAGVVTNNGTLDAYLKGTASTGLLEFVSNINFDTQYPNNTTYAQNLLSTGGTPKTQTQHLKISNLATFSIPVDVYGQLSFSGSNKTLATGDKLTLKSVSSTISAMVLDRTNGTGVEQNNTISGQVTVERFIDGAVGRKWRLVTVPVQNMTVNKAWQEGMTMNNSSHYLTGTNTLATPTAGFGTLITGDKQGSAATANGNGFDYWDAIATSVSSIRTYQGNPDWHWALWVPFSSTKTAGFDSYEAYLLFVRGDRSVITGAGNTVLRPKGLLKEDLAHTVQVKANQSHTLIGNPYASPLNFKKIYDANNTKIEPYFWVWQASLSNSGGGYLLIKPVSDGSDSYESVPVEGTGAKSADPIISSGEGFFVVPKAGVPLPTPITIEQRHKDASNSNVAVFRMPGVNRVPAKENGKIRVNVFNEAVKPVLLDGVQAEFRLDEKQVGVGNITKSMNIGENLSIVYGSRDLIVSTSDRPKAGDTVQLRFWNPTVKEYILEVSSRAFTGPAANTLEGVLVDRYLQKEIPFSLQGGIVRYKFKLSDAASKNPLRFYLVFRRNAAAPVPPVMVSLDAKQKGRDGVQLDWQTPDEEGVKTYELQHSADGTQFTPFGTKEANGAPGPQSYGHLDPSPFFPSSYYRIRVVKEGGAESYTNVVRAGLEEEAIRAYPNPVKAGENLQVELRYRPQGSYTLRLFAPNGQLVMQQTLKHAGGSVLVRLPLGKQFSSGFYSLEVARPDGGKEKVNVNVLR